MSVNWKMIVSIVIASLIVKLIAALVFKKVKFYPDGSIGHEKETLNVDRETS